MHRISCIIHANSMKSLPTSHTSHIMHRISYHIIIHAIKSLPPRENHTALTLLAAVNASNVRYLLASDISDIYDIYVFMYSIRYIWCIPSDVDESRHTPLAFGEHLRCQLYYVAQMFPHRAAAALCREHPDPDPDPHPTLIGELLGHRRVVFGIPLCGSCAPYALIDTVGTLHVSCITYHVHHASCIMRRAHRTSCIVCRES